MGDPILTSEIRKQFHASFVKIFVIFRAFSRGKLVEFWQNAIKIISYFHENIIWWPFNFTGDKLHLQSWVFALFIVSRKCGPESPWQFYNYDLIPN